MKNPIDWYDRIREEHRVLWHPETSSWYVTRFEDVWNLLVSPDLGARSKDTFIRKMTPEQREVCAPVIDFIAKWPVFSDPPRHTDIRRLILPAFSAAEVERVTDAVRVELDRLGSGDRKPSELFEGLVRPACEAALAEFLGMDLREFDQVPAWAAQIMQFAAQTEYHPEVMPRAARALAEFSEFVLTSARKGRSALSAQLDGAISRGDIAASDVVAIYGQMVTGILQPTMSTLATAVELVSRGAEYREYFQSDPGTFVSEAIRLTTPFHFAPRRTLVDVDIDDEVIPAGERIVLLLVSANRDPRRFPDPLSFRMGRGQPPHVAFARGRYACLGAAMTRQLMTVALTAVLEGRSEPLSPLRVVWNVGRGMRAAERFEPAVR
ncbi:cytochrome P450 [Streptantibioticus ferralitis]|uniref:Cytochrome P450 n=1 Tax=Streptantibioticus ferralitis TaxID=236510 RepID=A0ABT5Z233_9ACTN|nr:cytochrome P450 [Streptantibioticus ferralitis]MDF2257717.1 cytochrome P450 [Streptantibioticus ferralitis]